ncbi:nucleoside 2-deoxyribosyltransferase [Azospirillum sp. HJ39]|uniref:nucleoside 2-deoxyribosyltransferase n=1 Tax=Azospirillum sp. HJ39 TaxID=3159496 RepID=UPI003557AA8E
MAGKLLIVGEIIVDFTLARPGVECKLRLGGVVHAARGLWAAGIDYAVAAICPKYLVGNARNFLHHHGCSEFIFLGEVDGSPNVMVIGDVTEVADQGYEDILRDEKTVNVFDVSGQLAPYKEVLIFPGSYNLGDLRKQFQDDVKFSFDIAYNVPDIHSLSSYDGKVKSIIISTSSDMFLKYGKDCVDNIISHVNAVRPEVFLLKENRGGSRLFEIGVGRAEMIPAVLGSTVNSVGVGDVYSAVMVGYSERGWVEAAWRGSRAAMYYSQTTFPDDLKRDFQRDLCLSLDDLKSLGGTVLPWHERQDIQVYLAAPDFSYIQKPELDKAIASLNYHNFRLRRPVLENGEMKVDSTPDVLQATYQKDCSLLNDCKAVFAVPLGRDPGTLVEIGMAISMGKPVITFDPRVENNNTMVISGSDVYSSDLDRCLNGLFEELSKIRVGK